MFGSKKSDAPTAPVADATPKPVEKTDSDHELQNRSTETSMREISKPTSEEENPSVLSKGALFKGVLISPGPVHAQGTIEGELTSPHVTLGTSGKIVGQLKCNHLTIDGRFEGSLECAEVVASSGAVLDGELVCDSLKAFSGAEINGNLRIGKK